MRSASSATMVIGLIALSAFSILAILYAYRSQTPAVPSVSSAEATQMIQNGSVDVILLENDRATLRLFDGTQHQAFGARDAILRAVTDYNLTHPANAVLMRYDDRFAFGSSVTALIFVLLPLVIVLAVIFVSAFALRRSRSAVRYEQLARIAALRDRGVLSEDEFQAEKRKVLR